MSQDIESWLLELDEIIDEILRQEYILPPVEDDPGGYHSIYLAGFDDGLRACQLWLNGDEDMLEGRRNR